ncbi:MAG: DUF4838 domain-containing protein [Clostridia bacterium]|nr:DUF4838 domain-containing protein [Clostridia bacterium]
MKKWKSIIYVALGALLTFSACKGPSSSSGAGGALNQVDKEAMQRREDAIYSYTVSDSSHDFIKNGASGYVIVYPDDYATDSMMTTAVSELRGFVTEASGVILGVSSDAVETGAEKIISLGFTDQMEASETVMAKWNAVDVREEGFMIETVGDSVYIMGKASTSVLWGVYEFLHQHFNYKYYAKDCYTLDKNVRDLKLKAMDIVDVPDIQYRVAGNGDDRIDSLHMRRMRFNSSSDAMNNVTSNMHNYFEFIRDKEVAQEKGWISTEGTQLCFSRDPEGLLEEVFTVCKEKILADPKHIYLPFCLNDGGGWCKCDSCYTQQIGKYEEDTMIAAATVLPFMVKLANRLKEWNATLDTDVQYKIMFISYGQIQNPPVKLGADGKPILDENGNYLPYDEAWANADNLVLQIACGGNVMEERKKLEESEKIKRWKAYIDEYFFWVYSAQFSNYLAPYNAIESRPECYDFCADQGGLYIFDNARYGTGYSSDWNTFKSYVTSQAHWNTRVDMELMIEEFFDNYYAEASDVMQAMYREYLSYTRAYFELHDAGSYIHGAASVLTKTIWPIRMIQRFLNYIDEAYNAIKPLKSTDPERYEQLYTRIQRESITYQYLEIYLYPETFAVDALVEAKTNFLNQCYKVGIGEWAEHYAISTVF